eukprot:gnl/TRDRNA2_/TRDRNA2_92412_c0_seq1.p1 gnl/TRDRNA2_/TRDRNA2_92412_c0~~gnl/TRDRNA2_/TRDRNA2_92412_c0_seq1.p1  ORF type:complete len:473 (+),score=56.30 gnl/TRDRNA2_/TRDRNA2_92412_c0_seq1:6-1424(+)
MINSVIFYICSCCTTAPYSFLFRETCGSLTVYGNAMWSVGQARGRFKPGPRTSYEPALAELEAARKKAVSEGDTAKVEELDNRRDAILESMHPGLSTMPPCSNCQRRGHERQNCPRPSAKRWQKLSSTACPTGPASEQQSQENSGPPEPIPSQLRTPGNSGVDSARILWILGRCGIEMSLPTGSVRNFNIPIDVKAGSRAVGAGKPDEIYILENGSSRLWHLTLGAAAHAEELTVDIEAARFRSSLGSRLLLLGSSLLVTGTPGPGAHTPWLFNLKAREWARLPEAPHPILSSAVIASGDTVTIVGGWSKQRSCHGHVQNLRLQQPFRWRASPTGSVPWRRPGAGCVMQNFGTLLALGWMECQGEVGSQSFRLFPRNGAAQRARTSSSRLCKLDDSDGSISEISQMPLADSFEHNGEIYPMGDNVICIGRDHIQSFNVASSSWRNWQLPRQLGQDSSSSWVKHCGSWALTCI